MLIPTHIWATELVTAKYVTSIEVAMLVEVRKLRMTPTSVVGVQFCCRWGCWPIPYRAALNWKPKTDIQLAQWFGGHTQSSAQRLRHVRNIPEPNSGHLELLQSRC
jgi:hypothetical protein